MDRRKFLKIMGAAGATAAIPWRFDLRKGLEWAQAHAFMVSPGLKLFGPGQTFRAAPPLMTKLVDPVFASTDYYKVSVGQFTDQLYPAGAPINFGPTTLWGYFDSVAQVKNHLGGVIIGQKGRPVRIRFTNTLPTTHIIPVDPTLPGANQAQNRTATHLHGGLVPWTSDGGPFDWWDPAGNHGLSFLNGPGGFLDNFYPAAEKMAAGQADYYYPNNQSARLVWYHDHAHGITRLNAYAGIASAYIIRDAFEASLVTTNGLPDYIEAGGLELPIVIQDKVFVNNATLAQLDPTWPGPTGTGSLWYAHIYDPKLYKLAGRGQAKALLPPVSVVPEFFGDTMLANGTVYPTVTVQPRRYRFRILNACNARFLNLQLFQANATPDGITLNNKKNPANLPYKWLGPEPVAGPITTPGFNQAVQNTSQCLVIGNEGGFLNKPVAMPLNMPFNPVLFNGSLLMAPAERLDVLIDFSGYPQNTSFILYTDAPAPFPVGSPGNDFLPNGLGTGPNTREIMKFVVGTGPADGPISLPNDLATAGGANWNEPLIFPTYNTTTGFPNESAIYPVRSLTLNEAFDLYGRLIQLLGTNIPVAPGVFGRDYLSPTTESVVNGTTEIWEIANLTGDTHPIHFHLVNVQVLSRQTFNVGKYAGIPAYVAPARPPDPDERGWKETVKMHPGDVTRVAMRFNLPTGLPAPFPAPASPRTGGNEYVWHCHILEHEEHDMMRPLVVT